MIRSNLELHVYIVSYITIIYLVKFYESLYNYLNYMHISSFHSRSIFFVIIYDPLYICTFFSAPYHQHKRVYFYKKRSSWGARCGTLFSSKMDLRLSTLVLRFQLDTRQYTSYILHIPINFDRLFISANRLTLWNNTHIHTSSICRLLS